MAEKHHQSEGIFENTQKVVLPWRRTLQMCALNVQHRLGRSFLTFVCIAVVVAFFMTSLTYRAVLQGAVEFVETGPSLVVTGGTGGLEGMPPEMRARQEAKIVLERAGIFVEDAASQKKERDKQVWLLSLSALLCLVGITNTILMSVTERFREIGTLKCLGALDSFVIRLFFIESIFVGFIASLFGAAFGLLLATFQVWAVLEFVTGWSGIMAGFVTAGPLAILIGTVLTVLASVYPTFVAAKMKPVDAMRSEF